MLLINVLHQVKNSNKGIDEYLIQDTANAIAKQEKYKDYAQALKEAAKDITQYFDELKLYGYLERVRSFKWDEEKLGAYRDDKTTIYDRATLIGKIYDLFTDVRIDFKWGDESYKQCYFIEVSTTKTPYRIPYRIYCINLNKNTMTDAHVFLGTALSAHKIISYQAYSSEQHYIELLGNKFIEQDLKPLLYIIEHFPLDEHDSRTLLRKAESMSLNDDEMNFLDIWNVNRYMAACCEEGTHILYSRKELFYKKLREILSRLQNRLNPSKKRFSGWTMGQMYESAISEVIDKFSTDQQAT